MGQSYELDRRGQGRNKLGRKKDKFYSFHLIKYDENIREISQYLVGILLNVGTVFLKVTLGFFITLKMLIGLNSSEVSGFSTSWQRIRPAVRRREKRKIMLEVVVVEVVENFWRFC